MTHPTREEWMSFLYDELPSTKRTELKSHLDACGECRVQWEDWQGVTRSMDSWRLPSRRKTARPADFVRWAAAAAALALVGFGGMRVAALNNEVKQLRAEVRASRSDADAILARASEVAAKSASAKAQALVASAAERLEEQRLADQKAMLAGLQTLSARQTKDLALMRKELETVAVFTEAGLERTQNQLANIAYSPVTSSNNKQD